MKFIDYFLDRITMYRLLLYYLIALLAAAVGLSAFDVLNFNPLSIIFSAGYLTLICWLVNYVFAQVFETPTNGESSLITALILALIISPPRQLDDLMFLTAAGVLAMASKYILAIRKKHIFNPAAIAVVLLAFGANQPANWWVGTAALLPFVLVGGFLIIRKIERSAMAISFLVAAVSSTVLLDIINDDNVLTDLRRMILRSSLFFLASVMLTEPLTSPTSKNKQIWYGALVGALFPPQLHIGSIYSTPELALVIGNVFAYIVSPKYKLLPKLKEKLRLTPSVVDFVFVTEQPVTYQPGQYMEWTVNHEGVDGRGKRRYFTLASSPTEDNLRLGVKFYPKGSSFKKALLALTNKDKIAAGQLGGNFTLPKNKKQKLAFVAGGIGVTPYRSMAKYLSDRGEERDVVLLYSENHAEDIVYKDIFSESKQKFGMRTIYTLTDPKSVGPGWTGLRGMIDSDMIRKQVPDYKERLFYVSGPQPMVQAIKHSLKQLGVPNKQIKTDLFPGYA